MKIKLKLTREQLLSLCSFTKPIVFEGKIWVMVTKQEFDFGYLDYLFNVLQVGERLGKLYVFTLKKKYTISLTYSEAASLLTLCLSLKPAELTHFDAAVATEIKNIIHQKLTDFQPRFYKQQALNF